MTGKPRKPRWTNGMTRGEAHAIKYQGADPSTLPIQGCRQTDGSGVRCGEEVVGITTKCAKHT